MTKDQNPASLLVISAWMDRDNKPSLRARITRSDDSGAAETPTFATSEEEILAAVTRWLDELAGLGS